MWFRKPAEDVGVVYDLSSRGVCVSTEATIKPGDEVSLTLRLPKQIAPAAVAVAKVCWTKGKIYRLSFEKLSQSSLSRLNKYMAIVTMANV